MVCNPQREVIFCIGPDYRPRFFLKSGFSFHYPVVVFLVPDDALPVVPVSSFSMSISGKSYGHYEVLRKIPEPATDARFGNLLLI